MEGQILTNLPPMRDTLLEMANELIANTCSLGVF